MKISELNTNTFLNGDGVPENSYLLINYTASQGAAPLTQKVSLDTLGKAVAAKLNLPIAVTDNSGNVTGLQHVAASGNQYHVENLNASFGGGGSGGTPDSMEYSFAPGSEDEEVTVTLKPVYAYSYPSSAGSAGQYDFILVTGDQTNEGFVVDDFINASESGAYGHRLSDNDDPENENPSFLPYAS